MNEGGNKLKVCNYLENLYLTPGDFSNSEA